MLPFIAGLATGIIGVVAYKNNKKIAGKIEEGAQGIKKLAQCGLEKSKETIEQIKQRFEESKENAEKTGEAIVKESE